VLGEPQPNLAAVVAVLEFPHRYLLERGRMIIRAGGQGVKISRAAD
jgi:hypothetical protein